MRKILTLAAAAVLFTGIAAAQTPEAKEFLERYNLLVSKLGASGVGIETLLDRWEAAYPDDPDMMLGRFSYWLAKSGTTSIVTKDQAKFLGEKPVFSLKDSTGKDVNYFEETVYDDELFGKAQKALEKAIQTYPDRLDFRFLKSSSLVGYEKESPDMALSDLKSLIDYNFTSHPSWQYPGQDNVNDEFFSSAIQEYCYVFFKYATPASFGAFRSLSEKMLSYRPDDVLFLDNIGSYYLVAQRDYKTAKKYYTKVLKLKKDDVTAIRNLIILSKAAKDEKSEKKYLPMMIQYAPDESTRLSSQARLDFLNGKQQ